MDFQPQIQPTTDEQNNDCVFVISHILQQKEEIMRLANIIYSGDVDKIKKEAQDIKNSRDSFIKGQFLKEFYPTV